MMAEISVSLQDGESKLFPQGTVVAEMLKGLVSGKQRKHNPFYVSLFSHFLSSFNLFIVSQTVR